MTKIIERNTTIPARRTRGVQHRGGQPAGRGRRGAAGRTRAGRGQPGARPVPAGGHPAGPARRAADRGHLRHRRQRHPQVTARDKDTGAEQGITISESSNLDKTEVERMVAEAEAQPRRGPAAARAGRCPQRARHAPPTRSSAAWPSSATRRRAREGPGRDAGRRRPAGGQGRGAAGPGPVADRANCSRCSTALQPGAVRGGWQRAAGGRRQRPGSRATTT